MKEDPPREKSMWPLSDAEPKTDKATRARKGRSVVETDAGITEESHCVEWTRQVLKMVGIRKCYQEILKGNYWQTMVCDARGGIMKALIVGQDRNPGQRGTSYK